MKHRPLDWAEDGPTWPHSDWSRFVTVGDIRWHLQVSPPVERGRILFLHGTGASTHSWRDVLSILAERYQVIAVDLPRHGFTRTLSSRHSSLNGMAQALAALLNRVALAPDLIVGHSAGAAVGARVVLDYPVGARALVSVNGALRQFAGLFLPGFMPVARWVASAPATAWALSRCAADPTVLKRMLRATGSHLEPEGIELYRRLVADPEHVAGALAMMARWDLTALEADLEQLTVPLWLIATEGDETVPAQQSISLAERLPGSHLVLFPDLGHLAHEERPDLIANAIERCFLQPEPSASRTRGTRAAPHTPHAAIGCTP